MKKEFIDAYIEGRREGWRERSLDSAVMASEIRVFYDHADQAKGSCPIYVNGWKAALEGIAGAFKKVLTRESLLSLGRALGAAEIGLMRGVDPQPGQEAQ